MPQLCKVNAIASETTPIVLPPETTQKIAFLVDKHAQSSLDTESLDKTLRIKRLREFLADPEPAWKDEDHPQLVALGTEGWVHSMRQEEEERFRQLYTRD